MAAMALLHSFFMSNLAVKYPPTLARISHHLTVEARDRPAITAFRLLAVLTVPFKYASARQPALASY